MSSPEFRARRREEKTSLIRELEALGYRVQRLTEYQFRVDGRLDLYPTRARWHDIKTGERGGWGKETAVQVVTRVIGEPCRRAVPKPAAVPSAPIKPGTPPVLAAKGFKSRYAL